MSERQSRPIWKMSAGRLKNPSKEPPFWKYFKEYGFIAFGDYGEGDLRQYSNYNALLSKLNAIREPTRSHCTATWYWQFKEEVKEEEDFVIVYSRNTIWGVGIINGKYYYRGDQLGAGVEDYTFPHRRDVEWKSTKPVTNEELSVLKNPQQTFFRLSQAQEKIVRKIVQL
ncbi:MAG: hypothetical protein ACFFD4_24295 [Candidatus Odinarchaeota archaeon]